MSSDLVTMYSTVWCGYCRRLKDQMDREGIAYQVIDIEDDPNAADLVMAVNGGNQTVPTAGVPGRLGADQPQPRPGQAAARRLATLTVVNMRFAIKTMPEHTTWRAMLDVWRAADDIDLFESAWNFDHFYPILPATTPDPASRAGRCSPPWPRPPGGSGSAAR